MKILSLLLAVLFGPMAFFSQCCPYIDSIEVIPEVPNDMEETKVILTVTTPNQGNFIYAISEIENDNVYITACYFSGPLTALQTYIDTVNLGILPSGTYNYEFTAQQSGNPESCVVTDSQTQTGEFDVEIVNSVSDKELVDFSVYPNPVKDKLLIVEGVRGLQEVEIVDVNGQLLLRNDYENTNGDVMINLEDFTSGFYLLNVLFLSGEQSTSKIVIE